ncbi:hypothetical protein [Paraglaciecola psychrophila]|jgi:hypothetical protein|uniref:Uncharacterized protein n=1 Tax=Paraglaciecola psychrophila 170 TaxID=1129794 RepID=K7AHD6_9ALTE|nr:hypothetical protein [Paraglaciecola psychrophila]AGH47555.1 hypothetical protein C427_5458 [Paraglaciecola psychrophila 170]GAC40013.1 hypothetical protein GPSY_4410 [Paraglaciecola psychrophila 170]
MVTVCLLGYDVKSDDVDVLFFGTGHTDNQHINGGMMQGISTMLFRLLLRENYLVIPKKYSMKQHKDNGVFGQKLVGDLARLEAVVKMWF